MKEQNISNNSFWKIFKNEKGNATIMVLSVILILTAFGTVSLFASLANVKMGSRYRVWSTGYYNVDTVAEEKIIQVDEVLRQAEDTTNFYMTGKYYNESDYGVILSNPRFVNITSNAQALFYANRWTWSLASYLVAYPTLSESDYQTAMLAHNTQLYEKIYLYLANNLLSSAFVLTTDDIEFTEVPVFKIPVGTLWSDLVYEPTDWQVLITAKATLAGGETRKLRVELQVKPPDNQAVVQVISQPLRSNPLWGYALAAEGSINFTAGATVYGDVYANSGTNGGVKASNSANVDLYGNLYTSGDLSATTNSSLTVHKYNSTVAYPSNFSSAYGNKTKIYSETNALAPNLFMETSNNSLYESGFVNYTEGTIATTGLLPFFYQDKNWGNVYCNNLQVGDGITNAHLTVGGIVQTKDDVEMNGDNSSISIIGNFLGITSDANEAVRDPNASSSIINNKPLNALQNPNSSINLGGGMIVPGIAFGEYDSSEETGTFAKYYMTAESVSARIYDTFAAYLYPENISPAAVSYGSIIYEKDGSQYFLKKFASNAYTEKLADFVSSVTSGGINSRIYVQPVGNLDGYALGVIVPNQTGIINPISDIASYNANQSAYGATKAKLTNSFIAKTEHFGLSGTKLMANLVNTAAGNGLGVLSTDPNNPRAFYRSGNYTLNLSGPTSGIIYCGGDLTISGSGSFSGVILCEGDITVTSNNVTIYYNETVIEAVLSRPRNILDRAFFAPGAIYGADYTRYEDYGTDSGTKTEMKRYRVISWQEGM
ncbi:MAG: hypothetical protein WCI30_04410 [Clostridia bacterium]